MADNKLKEEILAIYKSRFFQIGMDICRVLMLIIVILILYKLVVEIEAVKMLNYDPCQICMNKTGAICMMPDSLLLKNSNLYKGKDTNFDIVKETFGKNGI
jgi:hypothetical protein